MGKRTGYVSPGRSGGTTSRPAVGAVVVTQNGIPFRVEGRSGGQIIVTGLNAPAGTLAAQRQALPRGARVTVYRGTLTGDRYQDSTAIGRFMRGRNR